MNPTGCTELLRVAPDITLPAMAKVMVDHTCHRVLVVERGRLLGLVSSMDVLRAIAEWSDQG
jgi:CBS domain-containing protein